MRHVIADVCKSSVVLTLVLFATNSITPCYCSGEVLVSENFEYEVGDIDGGDGGEGWDDSWLVADNLFDTDFRLGVIEAETPLVYALPGGGFINGGSTSLGFVNEAEEVLSNETAALTRPLDLPLDMDEIYFSYLYQYAGDGTETGGFIDDNDFVVWWFNDAGGPQLGLKGNGGDGSVSDDFVGRVNGAFAPPQQAYAAGIDISEEAGTLNDTWLVVGRMSRAGHSDAEDDYDQFDLWVNPGPDDLGSPDAIARCDRHGSGRRLASDGVGVGVGWYADLQRRTGRRDELGRPENR